MDIDRELLGRIEDDWLLDMCETLEKNINKIYLKCRKTIICYKCMSMIKNHIEKDQLIRTIPTNHTDLAVKQPNQDTNMAFTTLGKESADTSPSKISLLIFKSLRRS